MDNEMLAIYLSDHLAGATGASKSMRRLADAERESPYAETLERMAREIEEDRMTLLSIIEAQGIEPHWYKAAMARVGEALGMLKTNGTLFKRSPLSSLVELEAMRMGVTGKLELWSSLKSTSLAGKHDFDMLIDRANRQLHQLELVHTQCAHVLNGGQKADQLQGSS